MITNTESGSGGSGIGIKTGFEDAGDEPDYARQIAEVRAKVDNIHLGKIAVTGPPNRPRVDWLGTKALLPGLGLIPPSEAAILQTPIPGIPEVNNWHN